MSEYSKSALIKYRFEQRPIYDYWYILIILIIYEELVWSPYKDNF
jgi:hypothetical protein